MSIVPQDWFIVQAVSLNTGRSGGVAQGLDQIVDVFIHVNIIVCNIRFECQSSVFLEFDFLPAGGWSCFRFQNGSGFVCRNIARHLQGCHLVRDVVFLAGCRQSSAGIAATVCVVTDVGIGTIVPVFTSVGIVGFPVVASQTVTALPNGVNGNIFQVAAVTRIIDPINVWADGFLFSSQIDSNRHIIAASCVRRDSAHGIHGNLCQTGDGE